MGAESALLRYGRQQSFRCAKCGHALGLYERIVSVAGDGGSPSQTCWRRLACGGSADCALYHMGCVDDHPVAPAQPEPAPALYAGMTSSG
jgi:hypothetical protein